MAAEVAGEGGRSTQAPPPGKQRAEARPQPQADLRAALDDEFALRLASAIQARYGLKEGPQEVTIFIRAILPTIRAALAAPAAGGLDVERLARALCADAGGQWFRASDTIKQAWLIHAESVAAAYLHEPSREPGEER